MREQSTYCCNLCSELISGRPINFDASNDRSTYTGKLGILYASTKALFDNNGQLRGQVFLEVALMVIGRKFVFGRDAVCGKVQNNISLIQ
jgi:hypothetical protein